MMRASTEAFVFANPTPFLNFSCLTFNVDQGQVKLHGTNLCLDAGSNPGNGIQAKLWTW